MHMKNEQLICSLKVQNVQEDDSIYGKRKIQKYFFKFLILY